eukprot:970044-Alexandrium_andersonii.AAC.1
MRVRTGLGIRIRAACRAASARPGAEPPPDPRVHVQRHQHDEGPEGALHQDPHVHVGRHQHDE